jgi:glycosyltransferase involved in cell wall biosynthesis
MRVLFCYERHKPGGFCRRLYRAMNSLVDRGHEVLYLTAEPPSEGLSSKVVVMPLRAARASGILGWVSFLAITTLRCAILAKRRRVDRLVAFGPFYSMAFKLASLFSGASIVLFVRSRLGVANSQGRPFDALFSLVDWAGLKCANSVVVLTQVMKTSVLEILGPQSLDKISVLPNDVREPEPTRQVRSYDEEHLTALVLGAFSESKNLSFLLEVFSHLAQSGSRTWRLKVVGRGAALETFHETVQARGLSTIEVCPWVNDAAPLYEGAALLLHPSRHEGMPNAVLEAMSYRLPVLCADIPELRELMGAPECLFSLEHPEALAQRLAAMALDRGLLQRLGEVIHRRAAELAFDWDGAIEQKIANLR